MYNKTGIFEAFVGNSHASSKSDALEHLDRTATVGLTVLTIAAVSLASAFVYFGFVS